MSLRVLIALAIIAAVPRPAVAAPLVPGSDGEVIERLVVSPSDPALREVRALHEQLRHTPNNLVLAIHVARGYLELGRVTGDPRYAGYGEAALAPWLRLDDPPSEVLVVRATLRQRSHQFDAALADLATVLENNPRNAQARLTRATVLQVQGAYEAARNDCRALASVASELIWTTCLSGVDALTGHLAESYWRLRAVSDRPSNNRSGLQGWVLVSLAEMAARAGMMPEAEGHFRAALDAGSADTYLLGAYADFLLDAGRPGQVIPLLRDKTGADPLLLRYALALQARHSPELAAQLERLRDRFAASRLRGARVHLREEARFALHLLDSPAEALALAQANWSVQREPSDLRILLEAAVAAGDPKTVDAVRVWQKTTRLEDVWLSRLLPDAKDPT